MLHEEGVRRERELAGLLTTHVASASLVALVTTATAAAEATTILLVTLVAGNGSQFGRSVSKCTVSSIGTPLVLLVKLAFDSFEIVPESLSLL